MIEPWQHLSYALRRGCMRRLTPQRRADYKTQLKRFLLAMDNLGHIKSGLIMRLIKPSGYRRMLDVGGGLGTYAISFARANRKLRAVIYDLQDVVRHARVHIRRAGLQGRVSVEAGECLSEDLPDGPFDLVLVSNLLHIYGPRECQKIIRAAARALAPRGTLLIHDYVLGCGDQLAVMLFDMSMLVGTPRGRCHACADICAWLRSAGMHRLEQADVLAGTSLVWGLKKQEKDACHGA